MRFWSFPGLVDVREDTCEKGKDSMMDSLGGAPFVEVIVTSTLSEPWSLLSSYVG